MRNCEQVEKNLIAYLDGNASLAARREVETHLAGCAECRRRAEEFRLLSSVLDEVPGILPSPTFDATLRARIVAEPNRRPFWAWLMPSPGWALASAALVLFSLSLLMMRQPRPAAPVAAVAQPGSEAEFAMIKDLPALEDYDVLSNFDALSEMTVQPAAEKTQPHAQRSNKL